MKNPKEQLKEYLDILIFRFLNITSISDQLSIITDWQVSNRVEALRIGSYFYHLTFFSFRRIIILELCKILAEREEKSIFDWLNKAKEHTKAIEPSVYVPSVSSPGSRRILKTKEYIDIIEDQIKEIHKHDKTINILLARRDKDIAHADSSFFKDPNKLDELFPLNDLDIEALFETLKKILRKQHSLLFQADISMEIITAQSVNAILKSVLASEKIWKDRQLFIDSGLPIVKYFDDNS